MQNETQLERYKRLTAFIDIHYKEDIDIKKIEEISHYSYRNINRIFLGLHNETIGKYIKRIRLEKAAQYLKFSDIKIADIAFEVGFENAPAFNKAFKSKFKCSPKAFRNGTMETRNFLKTKSNIEKEPLDYSIVFLPDFDFLCLEYRGIYTNNKAVKVIWEELIQYYGAEESITNDTLFLAELLDDNEISEEVHFRYNCGVKLDKPLKNIPNGLFKVKKHKRQKYAKFRHIGSYENSIETYHKIYAFWLSEVKLELRDAPSIEIYPHFSNPVLEEKQVLEIYIPIL